MGLIINNTRATMAEECLRKYFWNDVFLGTGIEMLPTPVVKKRIDSDGEPNPLMLGHMIHDYLAQWYAGQGKDIAVKIARANAEKAIDFNAMAFDDKNVWLDWFDWTERMATEYNQFAARNDNFSPQQLEVEGITALGNCCYDCGKDYPVDLDMFCPSCGTPAFKYVFRIDMIINEYGKLNIMDHKTCKSLGEDYLASWAQSMQMLGYCYGVQQEMEIIPTGYWMNFIRKLKTIGKEEAKFKQCPKCRGGSKKVLTCTDCNRTGKVERKIKTADQPFVRDYHHWTASKEERFVRQRIGTCKRILLEKQLEMVAPDEAWPCNPAKCYNMGRCPYIQLCSTKNQAEWYKPEDFQLERYQQKDKDYVSMFREEMQ